MPAASTRNGYQKGGRPDRYWYDLTAPTDKLDKLVERGLRGGDVTLRNIRKDKKHFAAEVAMLLDIINDAWSDNWGYVPMTKAEIDDLAGILKILLRRAMSPSPNINGKPAAFAAIFPNLNEAIADMNGRLFPFNWIKLLWRMLVMRPKTARMPMMGVRKELQNSPLGAALAMAVIQSTRDFNVERGVTGAELSWILARNTRVRHVIELCGGKPYKTYRDLRKTDLTLVRPSPGSEVSCGRELACPRHLPNGWRQLPVPPGVFKRKGS